MYSYGDSPEELSTMDPAEFHDKVECIFKHNWSLLNPDGIYAILGGDRRHEG